MRRLMLLAFVAFVAHVGVPVPASAQLLPPTDKDQFIGVFLYKPNGSEGWVGAVSSKAAREIVPKLELAWQLDYGSLGALQVTPTGKPPLKEASASKNSSQFTLGYWNGKLNWDLPFAWRYGGNGGFEHKRTQKSVTDQIEHTVSPIASGEVVLYGNRVLGKRTMKIAGGDSSVSVHTLDWTVRAALTTALALESDGEHRRGFIDPKAEAWWSIWPAIDESVGLVDFYRFVVRLEAAGALPFGDAESRGHWDASATVFITKPIGFMVRRFEGHFDHNLRDRKEVTSVMLVVKF